MSTSAQSSLHQALWGDFDNASTFPTFRPLLAHYTSVSVLEKILEKNEVWFSNPLLMNDLEELRFGMLRGASIFRTHQAIVDACGSKKIHTQLISDFDALFQDFDVNHAFDTYVLCFSEHKDTDNDGLLSMWRGYGVQGSGVALIIDTSKLQFLADSPLILARVEYGTEAERMNWLEQKIVAFAKVLHEHVDAEANTSILAYQWFERLKLFSLFTKHIGFAEEREWRTVYFSQRDPDRKLSGMLNYLITSKGIEPKFKLNLTNLPGPMNSGASVESFTDRIILGPSISNVLGIKSVRRMLEIGGHPDLISKVVMSTIPYRPSQ